jgi:hypothetical protein
LWQFNSFDLFIPKIPPAQFFQKKKSKKQETGGWPPPMGWFSHPSIHLYIFLGFFFGIFFLEKKSVGGILGINRPNGLNCHNLKVWGGKVSHFKFWRQK